MTVRSRFVKSLSPVQSLLILGLVGAAISGWFYGLHWKQVASGELFSPDEKLMIRLQDQISTLTEENRILHNHIRELGGDPPEPEKDETPPAADAIPAAPLLEEPVPDDAS